MLSFYRNLVSFYSNQMRFKKYEKDCVFSLSFRILDSVFLVLKFNNSSYWSKWTPLLANCLVLLVHSNALLLYRLKITMSSSSASITRNNTLLFLFYATALGRKSLEDGITFFLLYWVRVCVWFCRCSFWWVIFVFYESKQAEKNENENEKKP